MNDPQVVLTLILFRKFQRHFKWIFFVNLMIFIENSKGSLLIQLEKVFRFNKCFTCYGFQKSNNKSFLWEIRFKERTPYWAANRFVL